jgi:hypothetical protein
MLKYLLVVVLFIPGISFGQWNNDPDTNNIVANTAFIDNDQVMVSDGAGGAIVVFLDTDNADIYAQKITASGVIAWGATDMPVVICNDNTQQYGIAATADGAGGAFIAWSDYRNNANLADVYLQHIDANGQPLWAVNGIRITSTNSRDEFNVVLCRDNSDGVIVSWTWNENSNIQVNAQRYDAGGAALWAANGVQACTATGFRAGASIVSDGSNGAILFFLDSRNDAGTGNIDIYAQRLNATGARQWTNNGIAICTAPGFQDGNLSGMAISDGKGGAIYIFDDGRHTNEMLINNDVYAQRISFAGGVQWAVDGIPVAGNTGSQYVDHIFPDGSGGFIAAWKDFDNGRLYSQHIDSAGIAKWPVEGALVYDGPDDASSTRLTTDKAGNFVYAFQVVSNGITSVHAQKLDSTGQVQWDPAGAIVSNAGPGGTIFKTGIVSSDTGTVIICFDNERDPLTGRDIYASKLFADGTLDSIPANQFVSAQPGNWKDPATWIGGVIPTTQGKVFIRHEVTVTEDTNCYSLTVQPPAGYLIVKAGIQLEILH